MGDKKPEKPAQVWVTRAEAVATAALACAFVIWVAVIVVRQHSTGSDLRVVPAEEDGGKYLIDLNDAEAAELMLIPGIGRVRAERIVNWRKDHSPFGSLNEVRKAAGLSAKDMDGMRDMVTLGDAGSPERPETDYVEPEKE